MPQLGWRAKTRALIPALFMASLAIGFRLSAQDTHGIRFQKVGSEITPPRRPILRTADAPPAQVDPTGRLFVLDAQRNLIDVYGKAGAVQLSFPGPKDQALVVPKLFAITSESVVGVIEMYGRHVSLFKVKGDDATLIRRLNFLAPPTSICSVGPDLYVYLSESGGRVMRITPAGDTLLAFRIPLPREIPSMQTYLYDAVLFGLESTKTIVAVAPLFPIVSAYSVTGRVLWKRTLTNFRQIEISQINENQILITTPPAGYQSFSNVFQITPSIVGVQTFMMFPPDTVISPSPRVETRFLSLADGTQLGKTGDAPAIVAASNSKLYGFSSTIGGFQQFRTRHNKSRK